MVMRMKKLMSMLLATVLVLSSSSVLAIKRTEDESTSKKSSIAGKNIATDCNFDAPVTPDAVGGISHYWNTTSEWVEGGANGTAGCAKIKPGTWGYAFIEIPYQETIGETFDISFYGRIDEGVLPMTVHVAYSDQTNAPTTSGHTQIRTDYEFTTEWKKYEFTWTNDGSKPYAIAAQLLDIWAGPGSSPSQWYLDEFEVRPRGDVDFDQYLAGPIKSDNYPDETGFDTPVEIKNASFPDMNNHWAEKTVELLTASSFVGGYTDGTYGPEKSVTRAEFVKMAMNALRYEGAKYTGAFSDIKEGQWFTEDIENANHAGLINKAMVKNGKFLPDQPITRQEAASIIAKIADIKAKDKKNSSKSFTDKGSISDWAKDSVNTAVSYGVINGYPDGSFGPDKNITRAEAATMLYRAIELSGKMAFYVDGENGNDENDGSKNAPFKTLQAAKEAVKPLLANMQNHIFVYIKEGDYHIDNTVEFTTEDSGQNGYYVVYTSWGDEKPMFNMGKEFSGFSLHDANENIYKTYVGSNQLVGEVWINDVRGVRATTEYMSNEIIKVKESLYKTDVAESILINPEMNHTEGWIICDNLDLLDYARPQDLEFTFHVQWCSDRCEVEDIYQLEDGRVKIQFNPDNFYTITQSAGARATYPEKIENAYELIDCEGEWYYNVDDGYLYYKPRKYEDPKTIVATIPMGDQLFTVYGDSVDDKIHNIRFENLGLEYTTSSWFLKKGNFFKSGDKAGGKEYIGDGSRTGFAPDASLTISDAAYIDVYDCEFARIGGNGVNFRTAFQYCNFIGNEIYDIGGSGLELGHTGQENGSIVTRTKFTQPTDYKYYKCFNTIKNNVIHDVAIRYESGSCIGVGFLKNSLITHNELYNSGYMGMVVGGGLNGLHYLQSGIRGLEISNNYIHDNGSDEHYDCGAIYFAGPSGGSEGNYNLIKNNYLENHRQNYATLYFDTGTTWYEVTGNVTDQRDSKASVAEIFIWALSVRNNYIHDNYSTTTQTTYNQSDNNYAPATHVPDANWDETAQAVVDNAGLTPEYLEKYPNNIQRTKLLNETDLYYLERGETVQFEITAFNRKLKEVKLPYSAYNFFSSDENIATIDENGVITATGSGSCNVYAEYLEGTLRRRQTIQIVCDDKVTKINSLAENLNVIYGTPVKLSALGLTSTYSSVEINPKTVHIDDESVATIDSNGVITAVDEGRTKATLTFERDGITSTSTVNVRVIKYNQGNDTKEFLKTSRKIEAGDPLFNPDNWVSGGGKAAAITEKTDKGGLSVVKASPSYCTVPIHDEVISFDLTITDPTSWPSLIWEASTLSATTSTSVATGDLYLFGFATELVELQRFKNAKHTAIFGWESLNPLAGVGFPNKNDVGGEMGGELYNTGVTYSITVGSIPVENGKRLILLMNGMPIYDYVDTDPVEGGKYLGVYNSTGRFKFEPFTDQRFLGYED